MRTRHWKQHWSPTADLVFTRRMRMGDDPGKPFCLPGEKVTDTMRARLGLNRLRRWFETGVLALADWVAPEPQREAAIKAKPRATTEDPEEKPRIRRRKKTKAP